MEAAVDVSSLLSSSSGLAVVLDIKVDCDSLAKRYMEARKNNSIGRNKVIVVVVVVIVIILTFLKKKGCGDSIFISYQIEKEFGTYL